jgi:hypothetical protein
MASESERGTPVLNIDSQIPGRTDLPNIRLLNRQEAADLRAAHQRTALWIVAANIIAIILLILTSA